MTTTLLRRLVNPDDERAEMDFYALYVPRIQNALVRLGVEQAQSEDMATDLWLRLVAMIRDGRFVHDPDRSFRGYILECARNAWKSCLADRSRLQTPGSEVVARLNDDRATDVYLTEIEAAYKIDLVNTAIDHLVEYERDRLENEPRAKLDPRAPELIRPLLLEEMAVAEAAEILEKTPEAVRMQCSRWRKWLEEEMLRLEAD